MSLSGRSHSAHDQMFCCFLMLCWLLLMRKCFGFLNSNTESAAAGWDLAQSFRADDAVICELLCEPLN